MPKVPKSLNRFLVKLTIIFLAASIGLYAGLARSNTSYPKTGPEFDQNQTFILDQLITRMYYF